MVAEAATILDEWEDDVDGQETIENDANTNSEYYGKRTLKFTKRNVRFLSVVYSPLKEMECKNKMPGRDMCMQTLKLKI